MATIKRRRRRLTTAERNGIDRRTMIQARRYARTLERLIAEAAKDVMPEIRAAVLASPDVRVDAIRGFGDLLDRLRRDLKARLSAERLRALLERQADQISLLTGRELASMLAVDPSTLPGLGGVFEGVWVERNLGLAQSLSTRYLAGVERVLREATPGVRAETLARQLMQRAVVTRSQARRLAVNETLNFHGQINQRRQQMLGIQRYEWSTSMDSRVRPWHERLNGSIQRWDSPPVGGGTRSGDRGHPSNGILCRCIAVPRDD